MDINLDNLPLDLEQAHALIRAQAEAMAALIEEFGQSKGTLEQMKVVVEALESDKARLQHRLDTLLRAQFGRSSEKIDPAQLLLFAQKTLGEAA